LWQSIDDQAKYQLGEDSSMPYYDSAWILGRAWVMGSTTFLFPRYFEEDLGDVLLPDYGGTDIENFARSRALSRLALLLRPPGPDEPETDAIVSTMYAFHRPDAESADLYLTDLRAAAQEYLANFTGPPTAGHLSAPRLLKTPRQAEEYAAEIMESFGFSNVRVTPPGADGGIDVTANEAVAQVKMEGVPTARPVLQAIYGNASHLGNKALVFSLAGFTRQSVEWADTAGVALFEFSFDGSIAARSRTAEYLVLDQDGVAADVTQPPATPKDNLADLPAEPASVQTPPPAPDGLVAQLSELARLHQLNALTDEEFAAAKALLLS
jgi:hypothetical protein